MSVSPHPTGATAPAAGLQFAHGQLTWHATDGTICAVAPPPEPLIYYLVTLAHLWHRVQRRCLAAQLLLDPRTGHWRFQIPPQVCRPTCAHWTPVACLPGELLAGSFQSRTESVDPPAQLSPLVPPWDGLHLVLSLAPPPLALAALVRAGGHDYYCPAEALLADQAAALLADAAPRLTLA